MSNMYTILFGENPQAQKLLAALGMKRDDIERYRDCELMERSEEEEWQGTYIVVTTRTGGANRREYHNDVLTHHPRFLWTEDDGYDSTYAFYYFSIPTVPEREEEA